MEAVQTATADLARQQEAVRELQQAFDAVQLDLVAARADADQTRAALAAREAEFERGAEVSSTAEKRIAEAATAAEGARGRLEGVETRAAQLESVRPSSWPRERRRRCDGACVCVQSLRAERERATQLDKELRVAVAARAETDSQLAVARQEIAILGDARADLQVGLPACEVCCAP
jgi:hypothetical protein